MDQTAIRVLYIDDDVALVRLVQKSLGRQGFEVRHAASGDDALVQLETGGIDVIALDHYLAGFTGLEFLGQLHSVGSVIPVVYVTGSSEMNVAVAALKAGAADFVPKTVGDDFLTLLMSALRQAVAKSRLQAEKEAAERDVRIARDRAEVLLAEVNHRVANSLAMVASLVSLQANAVSDQVAKDALAETQARIFAISLVHKRLYSAGDVRFVDLDEYLSGLLEHLETSMHDKGHGAKLSCTFDPLRLQTDASINLGVVVTEWVINAFKYAYPDSIGEVRVLLRQLPEGRVELSVEDDGIGRGIVTPARGTGLGTRIVKAMAASMQADIEYLDRNPGTVARLTFPLLAD
ncbi:MAG: two-component sensor protein [Devosia sp.]|nr:two-component sensor protein [Devosia sp.]